MRAIIKAALVALCLLVSWPVAAEPCVTASGRPSARVECVQFNEALAAYNRADYAEVVRLLQPLAAQGNAEAQYIVGNMYNGAFGRGVAFDNAEAMKWYRLAAAQGHAPAQFTLGLFYEHGSGVPQDYAELLKWCRLAAAQGYAAAQRHMGGIYQSGRGVPQDYVFAHMWYNLAAARGDVLAELRRNTLSALMTPGQIAEAQRLAREWKPTPAK